MSSSIRLILNGKSSDQPRLRKMVNRLRKQGIGIDVRVTWEGSDIEDFIYQASANGVERVIVGGGDGTVHGAANALMKLPEEYRPSLGIIPLGTANDFARAAGIPHSATEAFALAVREEAVPIDLGKVGDTWFINVVSGGFGASVTASTPPMLKRMLGGGAYSLVGAARILSFSPYSGHLRMPEFEDNADMVVIAIGNGRQAGGAQELTAKAYIDDGLLDVLVINDFRLRDVPRLLRQLEHLSPDNDLVRYFRTPWIELECETPLPVTLDGEMQEVKKGRFEIAPGVIDVVVPPDSKMLKNRIEVPAEPSDDEDE
ncbi:lipid kinase YegS [Carnimonas nigrificans]|uniref:lipid kinase YegS n=1 Tax=Carnimonas nigrificans TaxID=64323 RepID=UPI000471304A|nr:lipid kinase YegS [Carnimonas nigrificans]